MDSTFPATTTTPPEPLPAGSGPASASVSRQLPTSPLRRFPPSPPAADAAAMAAEVSRATAIMAEEEPGEGGDAAVAAEVEDRMDLLWEDFNEELAQAQRRARRGGSWRERRDDGLVVEGPWWSGSSSDAESEPAGRGCAPVLRPSSRAAGGARHYRRRAGTWVLLMRIFRRLFVIEKTISAAAVARQQSSTRAR